MIYSFKCATTLAAQYIVCCSTGTANTVKVVDTATAMPIGVTINIAEGPSTNLSVAVAMAGEVAKVYFNDTVTSGQLVASDAAGRAIPYVAASVGACYLGVLLDATIAATGTIAKVAIMPGVGFSA